VDGDDVIKRDKHHAANLLSRPNPAMFADRDRDVIVTAIANTQPPPSELAQHERVASHMPTSTPSELNQNRGDNQGDGLEQRRGPTQAGVGSTDKNQGRLRQPWVSAPHLRGPLSFHTTSTTTTPAHTDPRSPAQPPSNSYRTTRYWVSATHHHHHLLIPHPEPMSNEW
jgi:hypothetical protein